MKTIITAIQPMVQIHKEVATFLNSRLRDQRLEEVISELQAMKDVPESSTVSTSSLPDIDATTVEFVWCEMFVGSYEIKDSRQLTYPSLRQRIKTVQALDRQS